MKRAWVLSSLAIMGTALLLAGWHLSTRTTPQVKTKTAATLPLDAVMEDVEIRQFDQSGQLTQILTVAQWQHRQHAETAEWQRPRLKLFNKNGTWNLTAKQGTSIQKKLWGHIDEMHLSQDIVLDHTPLHAQNDWHLKTEYLLLLPDAQIAQTPNTVWIEGPWMQMKAQGLKADFKRESIQFVKTVDSRYHTAYNGTRKP